MRSRSFRRFLTRDDLIAAAFADKMTAYGQAIDRALAEPDPWDGFCGYIERVNVRIPAPLGREGPGQELGSGPEIQMLPCPATVSRPR